MTNVAGIFNNETEASLAFASLIREGFTKDDISFLIADNAKTSFFGTQAPVNQAYDQTAGGIVAGATLGAITAGLTAVGALIIPGINLLAVGPLSAALLGAEAGGIIGGISGLIDAELVSEKKMYDEALKMGKAVLIVNATSKEKKARAESVLRDFAALRKQAA